MSTSPAAPYCPVHYLMQCLKRVLPGMLCVLTAVTNPALAQENAFLTRETVREYIRKVSLEHQLDENKLINLFAVAQPQQSVIDAVSTPAETVLTWKQYRPIFIKDKRVSDGRAFMRDYASVLAKAEDEFGVPANIIASIIGVETFYGKIMGKHGVLESVATLAFDYPPRATFFKSELTEFLILSSEENWDALSIKGSYAGAVGWPQFISSSYRHYAIDFDGDGQRDLFNSVPDVIGSVANYLAKHGWKKGQLIAQSLKVKQEDQAAMDALERKSLKPAIAPKTLTSLGYPVDGDKLVRVMKLEGSSGAETWVGYPNFYVITRYNHSAMYALAVYQLSEMLTAKP